MYEIQTDTGLFYGFFIWIIKTGIISIHEIGS